MGRSKGQNIIEYVLLVTAVMVVAVIFFKPLSSGHLHDALNASLNSAVTQINNLTNAIQFK